jgi:hypothetical protein
MHSDSGSGTGIGFGSNTKLDSIQKSKGQKIKNERPTFWGTMLLLNERRQDLVQFFC